MHDDTSPQGEADEQPIVDDPSHYDHGQVVVRDRVHATADDGGDEGEEQEEGLRGMLPEERVEMLRQRVEEQLRLAGTWVYVCVWGGVVGRG